MQGSTIQRQSILSTIITLAGFAFGAINIVVLQPLFLTTEEWGLTRVVTELAVLLASFSLLGSNNVVAKFLPFYRRYLPEKKNDLPAAALLVFVAGMLVTLLLITVARPYLIDNYGKRSALFQPYFYTLYVFVVLQGSFIFLEIFAWFAGKSVLSNFLKEFLFRVLTTLILVGYGLHLFGFDGFMALFAFVYLPAVVILLFALQSYAGFRFSFSITSVTKRLAGKMIGLGGFVFLTSLSNIAFVVCDTLFLAGLYNFSQAGIYALAQYFSQVLEVPMRSMQSSSVPLISEYWRARNMHGLQSVYRKSCINLLLAAMGIGGLIIINLPNITRFLPAEFAVMAAPLLVLIAARWINLGTGLNAGIIQLSKFWRFDFASTLIYSLIGIPLNYLLIRSYGMMGAAIATLIAMVLYNALRFAFLYRKFGLQPFTLKNLWLLIGGIALILVIRVITYYSNLYVDAVLRSTVFIALFAGLVLQLRLSDEVADLWKKWQPRLRRGN